MINVNLQTFVINVPQSYLTFVSGNLYELDVDQFRLDLKDWEDGPGMPFPDTHSHNTTITLAGVQYDRVFQILSPYSVEFEDLPYRVNTTGANHNISDVMVLNQVQLITNNSAGRTVVTSGSGLDAAQALMLERIEKILCNKIVTDATTGTITVYENDDVTPSETADIYEDEAGTQPYRGQGIQRRERLR